MWRMRKKYPFMGKKRLEGMLAREEIARSESSLGRILAKGVRLGRIAPCAFCRGRVTAKKRRPFAKGHAQRWTAGAKAARPGEWIQIDHMSVSRDGDTLKEFKATCPIGKQLVVRVYSRATAGNARRFLQALREDLPYPVRSIQVDGGSEFRAEFEDAGQALNLPLAVLPPKSPQKALNSTASSKGQTTAHEPSSGTSTTATSPSKTPAPHWPNTNASTTTYGPTTHWT